MRSQTREGVERVMRAAGGFLLGVVLVLGIAMCAVAAMRAADDLADSAPGPAAEYPLVLLIEDPCRRGVIGKVAYYESESAFAVIGYAELRSHGELARLVAAHMKAGALVKTARLSGTTCG